MDPTSDERDELIEFLRAQQKEIGTLRGQVDRLERRVALLEGDALVEKGPWSAPERASSPTRWLRRAVRRSAPARWRRVPLLLLMSGLVTVVLGVSVLDRDTPERRSALATLPPGSPLPSEMECAARVRGEPWEPRGENVQANRTTPTAEQLWRYNASSWGYAEEYHARVTGNFSGTTDEIIRWAACKWGFDEDTSRAVAVQESSWRQSMTGDWESGDCPPGFPPNAEGLCPHSFGLMQIRWNADESARATFPLSRLSTAFNADYALAVRRSCFEGYEVWLNDVERGGRYGPGDEWGCIGRWYAGRWLTDPANAYIRQVKEHMARRSWRTQR